MSKPRPARYLTTNWSDYNWCLGTLSSLQSWPKRRYALGCYYGTNSCRFSIIIDDRSRTVADHLVEI